MHSLSLLTRRSKATKVNRPESEAVPNLALSKKFMVHLRLC